MQPGRPSRTAEYMALFRALEHARPPKTRLFTDPFAQAFLGPRLRWLVTLSALPGVVDVVCRVIDHRWPGARTSAVARTRLIDDRAGAAIAEGVQQIVLLGGGFDSRAYRLEGGERLAFFDVDHPSTQARKRQVVRDVIGEPSSRVRFVPTDFDRDSIETTLPAAGYDQSRPTLFIWEGVTNYLTDRAVDHTLQPDRLHVRASGRPRRSGGLLRHGPAVRNPRGLGRALDLWTRAFQGRRVPRRARVSPRRRSRRRRVPGALLRVVFGGHARVRVLSRRFRSRCRVPR
jgi:methyltransferase (TIGR00027 family)